MTDFVHLHVHSDFSLQDAAVSVMSLADRAEELGMRHLALTDHGNMFGAMEFLAACEETVNQNGEHVKRKRPIHPIIGCEVYVAPGSRHEKKGAESDNKYYHLVLLAASREGYFNLIKLCSFAYTEGFYYRPRVDDELLAQYRAGLIVLSACVAGEIPRLIQAGKTGEAEAKARYYRDLFGTDEQGNPNFYLEIQDHGITAAWLKGDLSQRQINDVLVDISRRNGIPLAATNDVHYLNQEDAGAHDVLLCIGTAKLRSEERRKRYFGDQFYLKSGDEMAALFPDYPEALANTARIAERCNAEIPRVKTKDLPQYLPECEIPAGFQNADEYLRHLTMEGLAKRYPGMPQQVVQQAEYELTTIISMNFTGYFLIVADFINWAKEHGIWVGPGRGSGAGSIVAYAMRITDIDPLKYGLLFERFLNPERISMPDFDIDFCNERREDVIKYVTNKYGKERVGQIITFGTLGAKQVVKDVARALNISIPESEMITKLIPKDPKITLAKAFAGEPKLRELETDPKYTELFSLARKLEGLNRHSSLHAAGIVIGKTALTDYVPLYREPESKGGGIATQYTMNFLESCGLVKMDFLGLKTLDLIKNTQDLIRDKKGQYANFDIEAVPEDDPATYAMLAEEKNEGVFQFEKTWWKEILKKAKPVSIEELTALNSLGRPGPMQYIPQFIESKWGRQKIEYPDPSLEEALKETYGVIVYQEQVMQVARIIAGYSMGQADLLRRAMGKKKKEIITKEKAPFIAGAVKQGFSEETAGRIYDILVPFAEYGFNKSHAAAYSVLSYRTAWLKANFPAEFMAANLTNEIGSPDKDKLSAYIEVARKMGLAIDPPDINRSQKYFSVADGRIFYGFLGIKGLGAAAADEIVACRQDGPYTSFIDFLDRVNIKTVGKSVVGLLIQTGAFDRFGVSRSTLMGNLERAVEYAQGKKDDKQFGQTSLFEDTGEREYPDFVFDPFPDTSRGEKLKAEKELIGFYFSGHPMDDYKDLWRRVVKVDLGKPETAALGSCVLVGIIKTVKTINTSKGGKMAFVTLADYNGEIEGIFFSGAWEACQNKIEAGNVAILKGKLEYQKDKDRYNFLAEEWVSPEDAEAAAAQAEAQARKWDKYRNVWQYKADLKLANPASAAKGTYTIAGFLTSLREFTDKKGNEMAFGTLKDFEGEIDLVFFASVWKECKDLLTVDEFTVLKGSIDPANDKNPEKPGFKASSVPDLARLMRAAAKENAAGSAADQQRACREVHIRLSEGAVREEADLYPLRDRLAENPGACLVFIHIPVSGGEAVIRAAAQVEAGGARFEALSSCAGVSGVWRA
ncbi:MAG: DNA polymerase III subunit alpha [Spirochaetaceae bacterium]|jgi:DNA polymerase-3 subunit alpha|nr:DNA polymerase III subunit alpha [Spirochaetaceae bacterium]